MILGSVVMMNIVIKRKAQISTLRENYRYSDMGWFDENSFKWNCLTLYYLIISAKDVIAFANLTQPAAQTKNAGHADKEAADQCEKTLAGGQWNVG